MNTYIRSLTKIVVVGIAALTVACGGGQTGSAIVPAAGAQGAAQANGVPSAAAYLLTSDVTPFLGTWTGTYGEVLPPVMPFETLLVLKKTSATAVSGTRTLTSGAYHISVSLSGTLTNGTLSLKDTAIIEKTVPPPGYYWCGLGESSFTISQDETTLNGFLSSESCNHGDVTLTRPQGVPTPTSAPSASPSAEPTHVPGCIPIATSKPKP